MFFIFYHDCTGRCQPSCELRSGPGSAGWPAPDLPPPCRCWVTTPGGSSAWGRTPTLTLLLRTRTPRVSRPGPGVPRPPRPAQRCCSLRCSLWVFPACRLPPRWRVARSPRGEWCPASVSWEPPGLQWGLCSRRRPELSLAAPRWLTRRVCRGVLTLSTRVSPAGSQRQSSINPPPPADPTFRPLPLDLSETASRLEDPQQSQSLQDKVSDFLARLHQDSINLSLDIPKPRPFPGKSGVRSYVSYNLWSGGSLHLSLSDTDLDVTNTGRNRR